MHILNDSLGWFATVVGNKLQQPPTGTYQTFKTWWQKMLSPHAPGAKERAQKLIYTFSNIWKEICRRVYENKSLIAKQL
jgi:hypothetical protein